MGFRRLPLPRGWLVWGHLFVAALIANALPYLLFAVAEQRIHSDIAGVLNATTPLWTLALGRVIGLDRAVSPRTALGFGLGFLGVVVVFSPWRSADDIASWSGLACLGAAASYGASYLYMGRYLTGRGMTPLALSAGQLAAATAILAVAMPFAGTQRPHWRPDAIAALIILGVVGTGLAYLLNYRIIQDEGAAVASTVTYLLPLIAIVLGWIALREPIGISTVGGVTLILGGVGLVRHRSAPAVADPVSASSGRTRPSPAGGGRNARS
jgi:drug/metabolite transporter (DMT)-like permease